MDRFSSTRRRFLAGTGAWLGAAAARLGAAPESLRTVSIFHTTDLHGHIVPTRNYDGVENLGGFARCATCIRGWRKESPDSLTLDIGDVYQGTAESLVNGGKLMIGLFNRLGYDAWTLGNHDFDWGPEALEENLALTKSPVLTGNIRVRGGLPGALEGVWKPVRPWMMKEIGGFRIALIGLVTPGLPYWLAKETLGGVTVLDPVESLKRSIAEARSEKADAIVVMGHMGWRYQDDFANPVRSLLKEAPGVDVFLAGHTHQEKPFWNTSGVLCTQASYYGIHCGRVDLTFDLETRKLVDRKAVLRLMDASVEADPAVMEMAAPHLAKATAQLSRKIGRVTSTIRCGGQDNPLAALLCQCFADALKRGGKPVDGVFHGTFGSGDLTDGDVSVADCWKILPYENLLVTAELTTEDLIEIVREERGVRKSDRILWPFEIRLDKDGNPARFTRLGKEVPAGSRFTIAFNTYDAQSGGRTLMRLSEILARPDVKRVFTGIDCRKALMDGILDRGTIP